MPRNDGPLIKQEAAGLSHYIRVAAMLVDGYSDLLPQEKWLYVALVWLCGKEGNRYLSLRYISERTGISRSALAADKRRCDPGAIQRLHEVGLIHAEIKRKKDRAGNAIDQAQYHITITDIWQLNAAFYADQERPQGGRDDESVRKTDTERPQNGRERPQNGRERPQNGRERPQNGRKGSADRPEKPTQKEAKSLLHSNITSNNYRVRGGISDADQEVETESPINDSSPSFSSSKFEDSFQNEDDTPTEESPAIRRSAAGIATLSPPALPAVSASPPPLTAAQQRIARYKAIYLLASREYGAKLLPTPDNESGAKLLVESDLSDEQIVKTIRGILDDPDPFWANQFSLLVVAKQAPARLRPQPVGAPAKAANGKRASPALRGASPPANPARGDTWRGEGGALLVFWDGDWKTSEEADATGYCGGFGLYK